MNEHFDRKPQAVLRVADLDRSVAFYDSLPGFRTIRTTPGAAVAIGPGGVPLLLTAEALSEPPAGVAQAAPGAWVYLHRPDVIELAVTLRFQGLTPKGPAEPYPGYRHLLLPDPDGYLLAFWEGLPVTDEQVLSLYRSGPERLARALEGLGEDALEERRAPGKWSLRQIVHHVVDSDLSTFHVIRMALALPGCRIESTVWEPDDWMRGLACDRRPIGPAVALFGAARAWVLEAVESLPDALDRSVSWPSGYTAQVRDLLRQVGGHAIHHIMQAEEIRERLAR